MHSKPRYWFPAKRYGWGWGPPATWQGWLVLALYVALLSAGAAVFDPATHTLRFVLCTGGLTLLLVLTCYLKGEPPRWRWGDR